MKHVSMLWVILFALLCVQNVGAQTTSQFTIQDESFEMPAFRGSINYVTQGDELKAPAQIANAIAHKQLEELHIYVATKPGAMVFNNIALTAETVDLFAKDLASWKQNVRQRVVVHGEFVFDGEEGQALKQRLEAITGLQFIAQQ